MFDQVADYNGDTAVYGDVRKRCTLLDLLKNNPVT